MFEVDSCPGAGTEAPQGHVAAQGARSGLSLQAALQCWPTGVIRGLWGLLLVIFLLRLLVTCLVTTGAFQRREVLRLGCGRRGMGRGRPLFEAQLLKQMPFFNSLTKSDNCTAALAALTALFWKLL